MGKTPVLHSGRQDVSNLPADLNEWNEAALLDRIVVWDRWIEAGIAPAGTKEALDTATQIIIERMDRLRGALREIADPPTDAFDHASWEACEWMSERARAALAENRA